jgi:hypothetical protein
MMRAARGNFFHFPLAREFSNNKLPAPQHEIDEARNLYKSFALQIRKEPKKK